MAQHFVVTDLHQQIETVHFGHQGIADDQVARLFFEDGEGLGAVFRRKDIIDVLEILDQELPQVGSVLYDHDVERLRFRVIGWFFSWFGDADFPPPCRFSGIRDFYRKFTARDGVAIDIHPAVVLFGEEFHQTQSDSEALARIGVLLVEEVEHLFLDAGRDAIPIVPDREPERSSPVVV